MTKLKINKTCIIGVVTHFWVPTKQNEKIQKISKIFRRNPKIIEARKGCWNAEKGQNWLRRFKNTKG
jgi:hypothetical protein